MICLLLRKVFRFKKNIIACQLPAVYNHKVNMGALWLK
jgi:hypothetical protein